MGSNIREYCSLSPINSTFAINSSPYLLKNLGNNILAIYLNYMILIKTLMNFSSYITKPNNYLTN